MCVVGGREKVGGWWQPILASKNLSFEERLKKIQSKNQKKTKKIEA
jgi:hypothetical protein